MVELATNELWSLFLLCFILGSVVLFVVLKASGALEPCKHEWEKIIDDSCHNAVNGSVKSHQVVHFCKKCGKYRKIRVKYV